MAPAYPHWIFELDTDTWSSLDWPRGTLFCLSYAAPSQAGDLVLALVNDQLLMARWFPGGTANQATGSWLIEPGRAIPVARRSEVAILGTLKPLIPMAERVDEILQRAYFDDYSAAQITPEGRAAFRALLAEEDERRRHTYRIVTIG